MQPIVDGLKEQYGKSVKFVYQDAADGAEGEATFEQLNLPGHPSYVLFAINNTEAFRAFGIVDEIVLIDALDNIIKDNE